MTFHALVRSKFDYAAPAWQPWHSDTNLSCLDRLQNNSFRLITGQLVSTPLEALRLESDVQSYPTCSHRLILKAKEKTLRSTDDYPKHIVLDVNTDKTSFIFHLHHGSKAPLTKVELPPLFLELLAELMPPI